jgi:hypothetical protein
MFFAAPVLSYLARPKRRGQPFIAMADYKNSKRKGYQPKKYTPLHFSTLFPMH